MQITREKLEDELRGKYLETHSDADDEATGSYVRGIIASLEELGVFTTEEIEHVPGSFPSSPQVILGDEAVRRFRTLSHGDSHLSAVVWTALSNDDWNVLKTIVTARKFW